ncbi:hypothetical protein C8J57DRAFT_1217674 [Mycena rebaudengoi]|nr:hypothetical protein C8J57DRAFT_1217674 [Mycena rebaudengoi]
MVLILPLILLSALGAVSTTAAAAPLAGQWLITDFQGRVFNLVGTKPANLTPVQGWWLFQDTYTANVYQIGNAGTGTFVSYSTAPDPVAAIRAQIVGSHAPSLWSFNAAAGGPLVETASGLALTSWPVGASGSNPVAHPQAAECIGFPLEFQDCATAWDLSLTSNQFGDATIAMNRMAGGSRVFPQVDSNRMRFFSEFIDVRGRVVSVVHIQSELALSYRSKQLMCRGISVTDNTHQAWK